MTANHGGEKFLYTCREDVKTAIVLFTNLAISLKDVGINVVVLESIDIDIINPYSDEMAQ